MKKTILALAVATVTLAGCMTYDPYTGEEKVSNATKGSVIGAIGGAAVGAATSSSDDRGKGALIGAASGAAVGGGIGYYMDRQEAKLRRQLEGTGVRVVRNGDQIDLIMPGNITFATDQSSIRPAFTDTLQSVALVLKEFDKTTIRIEGHTDSTGSDSYNQLLSERRASSVRDFLLNQGIEPSRTRAVGYGERYPVASNETAAGREQNRRVELTLVPMQQ
ncbi:OmpA family protein [Marinobacter persicus]|uniref:Outer membrane protein OmpA-like peptidoglycan-associated protein n=1 Tax=Marinobacter persicus TaxID=930118 RepID=A0A2S6G9H3_9GAMM|nr:OmpA family protein [Marinobacter persicus]PPK53055.1 outer membrane protein OmpA-like peptidoglycan-associated protein [Marinobacter persicus]PPK55932.1 outer membrane protein OmpA-like peptidoglycan-associated protein [Marinobacter persicus]PPK59528.1 outer membrane protein OmpA-like peptidoglycan-associated protein [Marinobacter persicus]